jgi:hypothetical protein
VNLPARTSRAATHARTDASRTNITVARDTDVEILAEAVDESRRTPVQHRQRSMTSHIATSASSASKHRTVAVHAFNVAVQQDSTTISLFEGRLDPHTGRQRDCPIERW